MVLWLRLVTLTPKRKPRHAIMIVQSKYRTVEKPGVSDDVNELTLAYPGSSWFGSVGGFSVLAPWVLGRIRCARVTKSDHVSRVELEAKPEGGELGVVVTECVGR